mmetsp:Transcript_2116/g.3154  ORF Transcript_2116/g.3154 Transcript_2116/m.3154 type:complete len:83 (+) Transcript_2116:491-739(+)
MFSKPLQASRWKADALRSVIMGQEAGLELGVPVFRFSLSFLALEEMYGRSSPLQNENLTKVGHRPKTTVLCDGFFELSLVVR